MEKSINPSAHTQCSDKKKSVRQHYLTAQTIGIGLVDKVFNYFYDESVNKSSPELLDSGLSVAISHSTSILPLPCYSIPKKMLAQLQEVTEEACKIEWNLRVQDKCVTNDSE